MTLPDSSETDDRRACRPDRGFLAFPDPLPRLPPAFEAWDDLVTRLPRLLIEGSLRAAVDRMEPLDPAGLSSAGERGRAMLALSMLGNAYVWADSPPASTIPSALARPWCTVADAVGRPPIASHASIVLDNWRRVDPDGPIAPENLETLATFTGTPDESWFYLVTAGVEVAGARAVRALIDADGVHRGDEEAAAGLLTEAAASISNMRTALTRMTERCAPDVFYHRIRPFLVGWPSPGVRYEGISTVPVRFIGGSAAQSSLVQSIDAALGIRHDDRSTRDFLRAMRRYMPPGHRRFVEHLARRSVLRNAARSGGSRSVREGFDRCVAALDAFRTSHFEIVARYITRPAGGTGVGTGGTPFADFLRDTRSATRAARESKPGARD